MMNRKMKQLALAVGMAVGSAGLLPSAQAVNVSADHLGQALIFPYYTVRGGWNTLLGITNTTSQTVAVKVRFREAYNSRDVLDFNVILSPYDLWNATVTSGGNGKPPLLLINADENTCTIGLSSKQQAFPLNTNGSPYSYDGPVDRMNEGYVEMIMMGAGPATGLANVPASCDNLSRVFRAVGTTPAAALAQLQAAFPNYLPNALKGTFSLVNGARGYNAVGLPTHLATFRANPAITLHAPPSSTISYANSWHEPSLAAADNAGAFINTSIPPAVSTGGTNGAAAVTFALAQTDVLNEWTHNPTGRSAGGATFITATDWVITFPTKNFYVDNATNSEYAGRANGRPGLPTTFPAPFANLSNGSRSCDPITPSVYNREEAVVDIEYPSPSGRFELCHEVNVLSFEQSVESRPEASRILSSPDADTTTIRYPSSFLYGWMNVRFDPAAGLPAVGFAITSRSSDVDTLLTEAALYDHSYVRP